MAHIKVIHLELEGKHYYFGSPKAMFDVFGKEELGMTYNSFHSNIHLKEGVPYVNARRGYTIRLGILGQAKTNRNNRLGELLRNASASAQDAKTHVAEETVATAVQTTQDSPATTHKRKKKDKEVPEQLTLF